MEEPSERQVPGAWRIVVNSFVATILFLIPFCFPVNFLAALPCARIRLAVGSVDAWVVTFLSGGLIVLVTRFLLGAGPGLGIGLFFVAVVATPAVVMAGMVARNIRLEQAILVAFVVCLIALALGFSFYRLQSGEAVGDLWVRSLEDNFEQLFMVWESEQVLEGEQIVQMRRNMAAASGFIGRYLYAILGIWFLTGLTTLAALLGRSRRWGAPDRFPAFDSSSVVVPDILVYPFILAGLSSLISVEALQTWCYNILIILLFIYLLAGLSVLSWFLRRMKLPLLFKLFFYVLVLTQMVFCLVLAGVGLFDQWFDFRKLRRSASAA